MIRNQFKVKVFWKATWFYHHITVENQTKINLIIFLTCQIRRLVAFRNHPFHRNIHNQPLKFALCMRCLYTTTTCSRIEQNSCLQHLVAFLKWQNIVDKNKAYLSENILLFVGLYQQLYCKAIFIDLILYQIIMFFFCKSKSLTNTTLWLRLWIIEYKTI